MNEFQLEFMISTPMLSVNDAYMDRPKKSKKTGRLSAYRTAAPALREYQERASYLIRSALGEDNINLVKALHRDKDHGLLISIIVGLPEDIFKRSDASNFIKPYEDILASVLGVDDKYNYRVSIEKYPDDDWMILTRIKFIDLETWRIHGKTETTFCSSPERSGEESSKSE